MNTNLSNGIVHQPDNAAILRRLDECIVAVGEVRSIAKNIANDQLEARTGIPASWTRRMVLVGISAFIGALVAAAVVEARHRYEHGQQASKDSSASR